MKTLNQYANEDDIYIYRIIQELSSKYSNVEALRGQWVVKFVMTINNEKKFVKVKKSTLEENRLKNKTPLTIKRLLK